VNLSEYMSDKHFQEIIRAHIEQTLQAEAERWRALMTGSISSRRRAIPLPVYDVLDAEIVFDDILDAEIVE
jgi:hypothetical protein